MGSILYLVLPEAFRPDRAVHLGPRNVTAVAHRSIDEFRVEIHAADVVDKYSCCWDMAFHAAGSRTLAGLRAHSRRTLFGAGTRVVHAQESVKTHLSLCRGGMIHDGC